MRQSVLGFVTSVLLLLAGGTVAAAEDRVALIIGNADYKNIGKLNNPENDATLMAATLKKAGFKVTQINNADLRAMRKAMRDFGRALRGSNAVGLFYYAGHGVQVADQNFLVPVDADLQDETEVRFDAVDLNAFLLTMERASSRINIVILDACRNNPFQSRFRSATRGLARVDAPRGTFIGYATAPGAVAEDGSDANSPFTSALTKAMAIPGLTIEAVFKRARRDVLDATKERQVPWQTSSITGDFFFTPPLLAKGDDLEKHGSIEPQTPKSDDDRNVELAFWKSASKTDTPAAYEIYLEHYPKGIFAGLAQARLDTLKQRKADDDEKQLAQKEADRLPTTPDTNTGGGASEFQPNRNKKGNREQRLDESVAPQRQEQLNPEREAELAFLKCARTNEPSCYRNFLARFPDHSRVKQVESILRSRSELPRYQACIDATDAADRLNLCELYLATFPNGRYQTHVKEIVDGLIADQLRKRRQEREFANRSIEPNPQPQPRYQPQPASREFKIFQGYDLYGGDYARVPGKVSYSTCLASCQNDSRCKAFTFNTQARACFLKSYVPARKPFANAISGALASQVRASQPVVRTTGQCGANFRTFDNTDFFGNDLGGFRASLHYCRQLCLNNRSCRGFSWIRKKVSKQCWLKRALGRATSNYGVISCVRG